MSAKKVLIITESTDRGTDRALLDLIIEKANPFGNADVKFIFGARPGGISDVLSRIKDLPVASEITGQDKPDVFIVVVDADDYPETRHKELLDSFDKTIFSVSKKVGEFGQEKNKIKTGIFLFPNSRDAGSLETLC